MSALHHRAMAASIRFDRLMAKAILEGKGMGKLSSLAERIRDTKASLEAQADQLAVKLDGIDAAAPTAFARGHAFVDAQAAEVGEIEDTLRQLSNLPLDASTASPGGLPRAANIPAASPAEPAPAVADKTTFPATGA